MTGKPSTLPQQGIFDLITQYSVMFILFFVLVHLCRSSTMTKEFQEHSSAGEVNVLQVGVHPPILTQSDDKGDEETKAIVAQFLF